MTTETWRPVVDHPGYEVSDLGRLRSVDRVVTRVDGVRHPYPGKVLVLTPDTSGYLCARLNGRQRRVHQLVAGAFLGPRPDGTEVCHGPAGSLDNSSSNLRWDTRRENLLDQTRDGTNHWRNRSNCPQGHELRLPNLRRKLYQERGYRGCLACSRAYPRVREARHRGQSLDLKAVADEIYAQIVASDLTTSTTPDREGLVL